MGTLTTIPCAKCRVPQVRAPGATAIACAHVFAGRPCEDASVGGSFTRDHIVERAQHWGLTVAELQRQTLYALLEDVHTWTP